MSAEKLVRMANQIAAALAHEPDPAKATARHINDFWAPTMRADLAALDDDAGLDPTVRAALAMVRAR